ncbi:MAG TPA: calcium-binding protein [Candidatus Sericytochromatia bacterium]|jgi:Ca2+-binding RTX toxin-like protein
MMAPHTSSNLASRIASFRTHHAWLKAASNSDTLLGTDGNDILVTNSGNHTLVGGAGNDIYILNNTINTITESANAGTDTVLSSVSYALANNLENLILSGNNDINGYGNNLNNSIKGNRANNYLSGGNGNDRLKGEAGNDQLFGGEGNDTLLGGSGNDILTGNFGNDVLTGGTGFDQFMFDVPTGLIDTITDFNSSEGDKILVSASGFGTDLGIGRVASSQFALVDSMAPQASDGLGIADAVRFIYDSSTGGLSFDADGSGALAAVQFATLTPGSSLSSNDICVFV